MEVLVLLLLAGALFLVVGAIQGMVALARTREVLQRLERIEKKVARLAESERQAAAREPAPNDAQGEEESADVRPPADAPSWRSVLEPPPVSSWQRPPSVVESPPDEPADIAATPPEPSRAEPSGPEVGPPRREQPATATPEADEPKSDAHSSTASAAADATHAPTPPATPAAAARTGRDAEQEFGMRWLTWGGVALLFLGVAFFLKYAYDRDWLGRYFGPRMRIATAAAIAMTLLVTGWRSLRSGFAALGQGLLGGGQGLLYLTAFAAFQPAVLVVDEPLLGATGAFALMAAITALGLVAAVRLDAVAMAFLALLGGLATPVLCSTGSDSRDALFCYLLLLDLGVLAVAAYRSWRALDVLAFTGTAVLFAGWWVKWRHVHPQPDATIVWLVVFHALFLVLPFAQHWRRRTNVTVERFWLACGNLAAALGFAASVLREPAPRLLAFGSLAVAGVYVGLGVFTARRIPGDVRARDGFLALAALLLTVGLFFLLPANAVAVAWLGEAAVLVWIGYRYEHRRTRLLGFFVLLAACARTLIVHAPQLDADASLVWNEWCTTLALTGLGMLAFTGVHRCAGARQTLATDVAERCIARGVAIAAVYWLCATFAGEVLRHAHGHPDAWGAGSPASRLVVAWIWLLGAIVFLWWGRRAGSATVHAASMLPLTLAAAAISFAYELYPETAWVVCNGPCLTALAAIAVLALMARWAPDGPRRRGERDTVFGLLQFALTVLATVETVAFVQRGGAPPPGSLARALAWVWLACAAGGIGFATARADGRVLRLALVPLVAAVVCGFVLYTRSLPDFAIVANQRYLFAACTAVLVAAMRACVARVSPNAIHAPGAAAFVLWFVWSCCEAVAWSGAHHSGDAATGWTMWLLAVVCVLGSIGAHSRVGVTGNPALRLLGVLAVAPAVLLSLFSYLPDWPSTWMLCNLRFALVGAAALAALVWGRHAPRFRSLRGVALATLLLGLTFDPPNWLFDHIADPDEARRSALFSITATWIAAAVTLLVVGFRLDRRPLRFTALGLFALTAAKLLAVDMSGAQQLYRILAFVLVGVVFLGASWVYHRAERRLVAKSEGAEAKQETTENGKIAVGGESVDAEKGPDVGKASDAGKTPGAE